MTAREASSRQCSHRALRFLQGGLFLCCDVCSGIWMAVDRTDPVTARPDFSRRGDGDCALRERPISEPPPKVATP